jgi:hypothetical protein
MRAKRSKRLRGFLADFHLYFLVCSIPVLLFTNPAVDTRTRIVAGLIFYAGSLILCLLGFCLYRRFGVGRHTGGL